MHHEIQTEHDIQISAQYALAFARTQSALILSRDESVFVCADCRQFCQFNKLSLYLCWSSLCA